VAEAKGVSRGLRRSKVADVMERCSISDMEHRLIGKLSKGYRQRVGLAQALLGDPEVLILDEPTIGLDPRQIADIRALIKSLGGQHTVILSTHILPEVSMVCDGIIIINRGRIVAQARSRAGAAGLSAARVEVEIGGRPGSAGVAPTPGVTSWSTLLSVDAASRFVVESPRGRTCARRPAAGGGRGWTLLSSIRSASRSRRFPAGGGGRGRAADRGSVQETG
jgi:ABC-2 type transport system ATP-binding protein